MMSYIYAIRVKDQDYFKIGWASDPEQRLTELQIGNPFELAIHRQAKVFAAQEVEKYFHFYLAGFAVRGEWFAVNSEMIDQMFDSAPLVGGLTVREVGDQRNPDYVIAPTAYSIERAGDACSSSDRGIIFLGSLCKTPTEVEHQALRLMASLLQIVLHVRRLK